jgi:hypothetical protein
LIRALIVVIGLLAAVVCLEPTVYPDKRSVLLRVRTPEEVVESVRARSRSLGVRLAERIRSSEIELPAVSAPGSRSSSPEDVTEEEQQRLDRLVEQVTRDP